MPLSRPTLPQLRDRIASDLNSRLPGTDARLRRANVTVQATVEAGTAYGLYGYVDYMAQQIIPDTAEETYLERWAAIWGLTREAGTASGGNALVSGLTGAVVPAGTLLQRADSEQFATTAAVTLGSGPTSVPILDQAVGSQGNSLPNTSLVFVSAIPNVNAAAAVDGSGTSGGADVELDGPLRARLLLRIQEPPQGGCKSDYQEWVLGNFPFATRVWVFPLYLGAGTVGIFFVEDNNSESIIPDDADVAAVQAYINQVAPVTATPSVFAPIADTINFTIHLVPDTTATRAAAQAQLADLIQRQGQPAGTIPLSNVEVAVGVSEGVTDFTITVPSANIVSAAGHMPVMGTITWD